MLTLKRAEVERAMRADEARLRHISSRALHRSIAMVERPSLDVIVKSVDPVPFLSMHCSCADMDEVVRNVHLVAEEGARHIRPALRDKLVVVARNDHDDEKLDLDIGFSLTRPSNASVRITRDCLLRAGELPGGRDDGNHRPGRHQSGKSYRVRRGRHLDRGQPVRSGRTVPRGLPGADHGSTGL